jgi:hypothetical protein
LVGLSFDKVDQVPSFSFKESTQILLKNREDLVNAKFAHAAHMGSENDVLHTDKGSQRYEEESLRFVRIAKTARVNPMEKVTPAMRREAKVINFGIIYGMSAYGLSQQLGTEPKIAQA